MGYAGSRCASSQGLAHLRVVSLDNLSLAIMAGVLWAGGSKAIWVYFHTFAWLSLYIYINTRGVPLCLKLIFEKLPEKDQIVFIRPQKKCGLTLSLPLRLSVHLFFVFVFLWGGKPRRSNFMPLSSEASSVPGKKKSKLKNIYKSQ